MSICWQWGGVHRLRLSYLTYGLGEKDKEDDNTKEGKWMPKPKLGGDLDGE